MTAEIAILNKTAVALAADSAVTISAGQKQEKIFDTADKLFELSLTQPIGIMVYNGLSFMEMPLPSLIKAFREIHNNFDTVEQAARSFLKYLNEIGQESPEKVLERSLKDVTPVLKYITDAHEDQFMGALFNDEFPGKSVDEIAAIVFSHIVDPFITSLSKRKKADFIDAAKIILRKEDREFLEGLIDPRFSSFDDGRLLKVCELVITKDYFSSSRTGIVVAGFGAKERFPKLISNEIDGLLISAVKYRVTGKYDIDREGAKAAVLPFAQKEMVDRFLYGLDDEIQKGVKDFCREGVSKISDEIFDKVKVRSKAKLDALKKSAKTAEASFLASLNDKAFKTIREQSRKEIEDMVEFMPKPELAKMAEALVELTSIKRRVSRGMETVGGPIDVAVISKAEGFVWVKRKHYFPPELNARYFDRVRRPPAAEKDDGPKQ